MRRGIYCSLMSSCSFALLYYLITLLAPLGGLELLGLRSVILLPALLIIIVTLKMWGQVSSLVNKVRKNRKFLIVPLCTAALVAFLQWLFFWAPLNGKALDVSLGFFLLPLFMVVFGSIVYKERITLLKGIAVLLAFSGVANMVWRSGGVSWVALCLSLGYVLYFAIRKKFSINNLGGLLVETLFFFPFAIYLVIHGSLALNEAFMVNDSLVWILPIFGLISVGSLSFYIIASDYLPMSMFGLLSYIEPVLLFFVSLYVGQVPGEGEQHTYLLLMLALVILGFEGAKSLRHEMKMQKKFRTTE